jgi:hypothetical protein
MAQQRKVSYARSLLPGNGSDDVKKAPQLTKQVDTFPAVEFMFDISEDMQEPKISAIAVIRVLGEAGTSVPASRSSFSVQESRSAQATESDQR